MPAVPALPTIGNGQLLTSDLAAVVSGLAFILSPPLVSVSAVATQSLTTAVWTSLNFDVDVADQDYLGPSTMHSTSVNTSRLTAVWPMWYWPGGCIVNGFNATGARGARWAVNGFAVGAGNLGPAVAATFGANPVGPGQAIFLNIGDYLELQAFQNSGGSLVTVAGSTASMFGFSK